MTSPETSITFTPDVHRNSQENDKCRDTSKRTEHLHWSARCDPVVDIITHAIEEEILERHAHDENFVGQIAVSIENVRARRDGSNEDTKEHETVDNGGDGRVSELLETITIQAETENGKDETDDHREETEFRFVDSLVPVGAEFNDWIRDDGHKNRGGETSDRRAD